MFKYSLMLLLLLQALPSAAKKYERDYQNAWCATRGVSEFMLPDRTRVDCLTETHAIEFDFSRKWAEALGQSLHYAIQTQKRAGIVLILNKNRDKKHLATLQNVINKNHLPVDVWVLEDYLDEY